MATVNISHGPVAVKATTNHSRSFSVLLKPSPPAERVTHHCLVSHSLGPWVPGGFCWHSVF